MKRIFTFILTKSKQHFRKHGIELDAEELSFQLFKGLSMQRMTLSSACYPLQVRIGNAKVRFNFLKLLVGKNPIYAMQCDHVEGNVRGLDDEWKIQVENFRLKGQHFECLAFLYHKELVPVPLSMALKGVILMQHTTKNGLNIKQTMEAGFSQFNVNLKFEFQTGATPLITCALNIPDFQPEDIVASFPIFTDKQPTAFRTSGSLRFVADLVVQLADPWKYSFKAELLSKDFSFAGDGFFDLAYLSDPFLHTVRGQNLTHTTIFLGKADPEFAGLDRISPILPQVIVSTEDPRFYLHHGFDSKLFGYALVTDIREKRAARGGSTITMQMVRNLFLHHGKSIYRKLEEVILTWMIEDIYRIPKSRIIEIYLNIIEFGPGIYGIKAACLFYFANTPDRLTLTQAIVLSYIIPRPRHFAAALKEKSPLLPARLGAHVRHTGRVLKRKGVIGEEELSDIGAAIRFAGSLGEIQFA